MKRSIAEFCAACALAAGTACAAAPATDYKKTKLTIMKLKPKKVYYVQIRTYQKVNGKKYYSEWSAAKKVKTR